MLAYCTADVRFAIKLADELEGVLTVKEIEVILKKKKRHIKTRAWKGVESDTLLNLVQSVGANWDEIAARLCQRFGSRRTAKAVRSRYNRLTED